MKIRIGTRASKLALWQANRVSTLLSEAGHQTEIITITTTGDRRHDVQLAEIGGKGLFIKEIEEALARGEVDVAVHSLKDVPSLISDEFTLAAFLARAEVRDAWISRYPVDEFPRNGRIGTSSPRRRAQILEHLPHATALPIRGNVDTRLAKLDRGDYDAILLAGAGLERLGMLHRVTSLLPVSVMLPAAGQATIGIECAASRVDVIEAMRAINDARAETEALAERGVLQHFGALLDCHSPIAVHASADETTLTIHAYVSTPAGDRSIRITRQGTRADAAAITREVFDDLVGAGARQLLLEVPA